VLLFGGTSEASALGRVLAGRPGVEVTTSFAGRTTAPRAPAGRTRVGGFGGVSGLVEHVHASGVDVLIDATHPFAARMRWHVAEAAELTGRPRLRVERPGWVAGVGDRWERVPDLAAAAAAVDAAGHRRVLLTTGRNELAPFARCRAAWFLVRTIEPPDPLPLPQAELLLARGPFTVADEGALLDAHRIDAVVTKDSGGGATVAKLVAARERGLPVVVVDRPPSPGGALVRTVAEALRWFDAVAAAGRRGP
jgi:precorrin-6A/cobalt-precorrin-6A reductase